VARFKLSLPKPATRHEPEPVSSPHPGHIAGMEEGKGTYRVLVGKPEGKRPLGRPKSVREGNTKTHSRIKRDQLDVTCFIISLYNAQHASDVKTSVLTSLRLICRVISWFVLL